MSDFALEWDSVAGGASVVIVNNDLKADDSLETSLLISLFTDASAQPGDVLPDGTIAKGGERGWWGDAVPVIEGDRTGSRLWLLERCAELPEHLGQAVRYASESVEWLKTAQVTDRIDVTAEFLKPSGTGLAVGVTVYRPDGTVARHRFDRTWAAEAARI